MINSNIKNQIISRLDILNSYLAKKKTRREFTITGGASLILKGIISRSTQDIDIVAPKIDDELRAIAVAVATKMELSNEWLNDHASVFDQLPKWETRRELVYTASNLSVFSLGRKDLLFQKMYAEMQRGIDFDDIAALAPNDDELIEMTMELKKRGLGEVWDFDLSNLVERIKNERDSLL